MHRSMQLIPVCCSTTKHHKTCCAKIEPTKEAIGHKANVLILALSNAVQRSSTGLVRTYPKIFPFLFFKNFIENEGQPKPGILHYFKLREVPRRNFIKIAMLALLLHLHCSFFTNVFANLNFYVISNFHP